MLYKLTNISGGAHPVHANEPFDLWQCLIGQSMTKALVSVISLESLQLSGDFRHGNGHGDLTHINGSNSNMVIQTTFFASDFKAPKPPISGFVYGFLISRCEIWEIEEMDRCPGASS